MNTEKINSLPYPDCKRFNGYKPCYPYHNCLTEGCRDRIPIGKKILIIHLEALGAVLSTTAQLPALKRKYPESTICWLTLKNAVSLLANNPYIDKVFTYDFQTLSVLSQMEFDVVLNADKSQHTGALAMSLNAKERLGFGINPNGQIIPLNDGAVYNYMLGLDDKLKFRENQKTIQEFFADTFELEYSRDEYQYFFTDEEKDFICEYKRSIGLTDQDRVIGFNTGCSLLFPNKKMTVEQHVYLIEKLLAKGGYKILLLGGPEDKERNDEIFSRFNDSNLINTPANMGIRRGACFIDIADIIVTGDSFGMHMSIALKKFIIAWFGLSCWSEIDLYDRGVKMIPEGLECAPCWKRQCPYNLECRQMIDLDGILDVILNYKF